MPVRDDAAVAKLTPRQRLAKLSLAFANLTAARSRHGPIMVLYEDVQWVDPSTIAAMAIISERIARLPMLAVLTARPEFEPPFPAGRLELAPLRPEDVVALVHSLSPTVPLADRVVADIVSRTDGVPLFVEELTRRVLEGSELAAAPAHGVPVTLMSALTARLDGLGGVRALATAASVIGRDFTCALVADVAGMREEDVPRELQRLHEAGIVQQTGEDGWRFRHALMQEAAYGLAPRRQRAVLHGRAAAAISAGSPRMLETRPQVVARHWTLAGNAQAAVPLWLAAGSSALQRGALQEATINLQEGLRLVAELPPASRHTTELRLQMVLGKTQVAMLGHAADVPAETYAHARVIAEAIGADEALVHILFVQWTRALVGAEFRRADELAGELLRSGRRRRHRPTVVMGLYAQGITLIPLGPFGPARRLLERAIAAYDPADRDAYRQAMIGHPLLMMKAFLACVMTRQGSKDAARTILDDAIAESERLGDAYALVNALWHRAYLAHVDEPAEATLAWADRAVQVADDCGALYYSAMAHSAQGWAVARLGDLKDGLRRAREAAGAYVATGGRLIRPEQLTEQALILGRMGDISGALALLHEALAEAEATGGRWALPGAFAVKSHLLERGGDAAAARTASQAARAAARAIGQRLVPIGLFES